MKNLASFFMIFLPICIFGQVNESFSDGNFSNNPTWTGTSANFVINNFLQLQSAVPTTSNSYLCTESEAFDDAVWECWLKINYSTSSSNYASVYLTSDRNDLSVGCNGYYVQVGGTNDEVSLFLQEGTKKTKIIDGIDKRTDGNTVELRIKVTRDTHGNFNLYSKLASETDFVLEGIVQNSVIKKSKYFGLFFANTTTTGLAYYFDDIVVTGNKALDLEPPIWLSLTLIQPNQLILVFSESMDFSTSAYTVNQEIGIPYSQIVSNEKNSITLTFEKEFEKGKIYQLQLSGLKDLAGNVLQETERSIGIPEPIGSTDLVFNEIMFENPLNSLEYIEIYNRSEKLLDLSGLIFTTRKTDGTLNTGNKIPEKTLLIPHASMALCEDAEVVRNYHHCPSESNIISTSWAALNNETATLILCNSSKDTIYDALTYNVKWHNVLVKNPKGVALEKINPDLPTQSAESWHSAASEVNFGTPGYKNSQFREINNEGNPLKTVWIDPEVFSPDNDGIDDVCFIRYKTEIPGFIASALVLSPSGINIIRLATNVLLGSEGYFIWDGKTDKGKNVNGGIYVLYFEMFNPENGAKSQFKLPIVVSCR